MNKEKFKRKDVKIIITPEEYDSIINAINKCSDGAEYLQDGYVMLSFNLFFTYLATPK